MHTALRLNVENVDRFATDMRPSSRKFRAGRQRISTEDGDHFRSLAVVGHHTMELAIELPNMALGRSGQSNRIRDQRVEHRLKLGR